jgi:hypothetical protein
MRAALTYRHATTDRDRQIAEAMGAVVDDTKVDTYRALAVSAGHRRSGGVRPEAPTCGLSGCAHTVRSQMVPKSVRWHRMPQPVIAYELALRSTACVNSNPRVVVDDDDIGIPNV